MAREAATNRKSQRGNEAVLGHGGGKAGKRRYLPRSRRLRLAIVVVLALIAGVAYYVGENVGVEQDVELAVTADQGEATVAIAGEKFGVSPGCGCQNPEGGDLDWTGLALPSKGFRLGVEAEPAENVAEGTWQLTALAPDTDHIDWYASPYATLEMRVTVSRGGLDMRLFEGRTTFLQLIRTDRSGLNRTPASPTRRYCPPRAARPRRSRARRFARVQGACLTSPAPRPAGSGWTLPGATTAPT